MRLSNQDVAKSFCVLVSIVRTEGRHISTSIAATVTAESDSGVWTTAIVTVISNDPKSHFLRSIYIVVDPFFVTIQLQAGTVDDTLPTTSTLCSGYKLPGGD